MKLHIIEHDKLRYQLCEIHGSNLEILQIILYPCFIINQVRHNHF